MKNEKLIAVVLLVVGLGIGFFGGMQYDKSQTAKSATSFTNGQGRGQGGQRNSGGNGGNRPVAGDIISSDDKSITIKMQDGSSKIVLISGTTLINKAAQATIADLKSGEKVAVFGSTNSDGSITAANIQLNPMQRMNGNDRQQGTQSGRAQ